MDKMENAAKSLLKGITGPLKLKEFIQAVRACKTAAEEREAIAKESAVIRTAFKDENADYRHRSVGKLLYIHMLGYPAQFGQVECVKLVASPKLADKRLGYLGIMLLLDESAEVLTLVTNSLKNDLNHPNVYVNGLALCTLGNISSQEMARDLATEVEKLMGSQSAYVRKKAYLAAVRIVRKVPELYENFTGRAKAIFQERNHATILTGLTLVAELARIDPQLIGQFRESVPDLVRLMKALSTASGSSEHEVNGIADPFLQVRILRLMRLLGHGDAQTSEKLSDTLARVATNTDASKNVGNAILYETVLTIMEIEAEQGLRVLAINLLGRFLSNRDNNIRYVALNTLLKTISKDVNAVQRHRATVLECLQDQDISIRRRALDLTFALINESTIRVIVRELLTFLERADKEFKPRIASEISQAAERDAPNKRWHADTILRVLRLAGNYVEDDILSNFIRLVAANEELHAYAVAKLYMALLDDVSQEALVHAGVWAIGEYGDVLVRNEIVDPEEQQMRVTEENVLDLLESIIRSPYTSETGREYVITALMKLSTRFPSNVERIRSLLQTYVSSTSVELQQRATEYLALFRFDSVRNALLERMPIPELRDVNRQTRRAGTGSDADAGQAASPSVAAAESPALSRQAAPQRSDRVRAAQSAAANLLELDLLGDGPSQPAASAQQPQRSSAPASNANAADDLMSLFGSGSQPRTTAQAAAASFDPLGDLLGGLGSSAPAAAAAAPSGVIGYNKNGVALYFQPVRDQANPTIVNVNCVFQNGSPAMLTNFVFQAAVPKGGDIRFVGTGGRNQTQKLQMQPASSAVIPPGGSATQLIRVVGADGTAVRLRIKLSFLANGQPFEDTGDVSNIPVV